MHFKILVHVLELYCLCDQLLYLLRILIGKHVKLHVTILKGCHREFTLLHLVNPRLYVTNGLPHLTGFEGDLGDLLQFISVDVGHNDVYDCVWWVIFLDFRLGALFDVLERIFEIEIL